MGEPIPMQKETRMTLEDITRCIRERVCTDDPTAETVLFETELSREFQVSRTPIRQVLQRLAYEQLVRTVSGVGTVVIPLNAGARTEQEHMFEMLLKFARQRANPVLVQTISLPQETEAYLAFRGMLIDQATQQIDDSILQSALVAAAWRDTRWALADLRRGGQCVWQALHTEFNDIPRDPLSQLLTLLDIHRNASSQGA
jgi:DNA-binding GntR family transcriptional regulator